MMCRRIFLMGIMACLPVSSLAAAAPDSSDRESQTAGRSELETLEDALLGGDIVFNLRLRSEFVEQDGTDDAWALLQRLRLGYGSQSWQGFSFYVEMEDIRTADDDRYNAAGTNANPNKAVVADPEDTEINQAYLKYENDDYALIYGRQRINLDDQRFVGAVGWRMNEQTFDAITAQTRRLEYVTLFYSYLWDVNRIFGPDADRDFESNSHLISVSLNDALPLAGKLTVFTYLLDFDNAPAASSDTYGLRLSGSNDLSDETQFSHVLSYARQTDGNDNASEYDTDYSLVEGTVTQKGLGHVGGGWEVLGSDNHTGFQTPLATLHKFNGWADAFLSTPANGLEDIYVFAGKKLPCDVMGKVIYHCFSGEGSGGRYGEEIDFVLSKKLSQRLSVLAKFAAFNGRQSPEGPADRTRFWLQTEYAF